MTAARSGRPESPPRRDSAAVAKVSAAPPSPVSVSPVYRPDDDRPAHDAAALERIGIRLHASQHLLLYSDLPAADVEGLPALVDAVYDDWVDYFGEFPPARDGGEYQLTGYLIGDLDRFRSAGLVPQEITFEHGRHLGRRFWMRNQEHAYYREHLLLHEATHCFMTALPGSESTPVWYLEGMAELFGCHRTGAGGKMTFGVMPGSPEDAAGFGRITLVREEVAAGRFKSLEKVFTLRPEQFSETTAYAWSWAACAFLYHHPRYRERFREIGDPRRRPQFVKEVHDRFAGDRREMEIEWAHFAHTLRYGYDIERAEIPFRPKPNSDASRAECRVASDRGWQPSGIRVASGKTYRIEAHGRFTLAADPKPWESGPDGITFDYFDGRPLGRLLAAVLAEPPDARDDASGLLSPIDLGRDATFAAPAGGMLYFRLNDGWDRLADNRGELQVTVTAVGGD